MNASDRFVNAIVLQFQLYCMSCSHLFPGSTVFLVLALILYQQTEKFQSRFYLPFADICFFFRLNLKFYFILFYRNYLRGRFILFRYNKFQVLTINQVSFLHYCFVKRTVVAVNKISAQLKYNTKMLKHIHARNKYLKRIISPFKSKI